MAKKKKGPHLWLEQVEKDPEWQGIRAAIEELTEAGEDEAEAWRREAADLFAELIGERSLRKAWRAIAEAQSSEKPEGRPAPRLQESSRAKPPLRLVRRKD